MIVRIEKKGYKQVSPHSKGTISIGQYQYKRLAASLHYRYNNTATTLRCLCHIHAETIHCVCSATIFYLQKV